MKVNTFIVVHANSTHRNGFLYSFAWGNSLLTLVGLACFSQCKPLLLKVDIISGFGFLCQLKLCLHLLSLLVGSSVIVVGVVGIVAVVNDRHRG